MIDQEAMRLPENLICLTIEKIEEILFIIIVYQNEI